MPTASGEFYSERFKIPCGRMLKNLRVCTRMSSFSSIKYKWASWLRTHYNTKKWVTLHMRSYLYNVKVSPALVVGSPHNETQNEEKMASDFRHSRNVKTQRQISNERIIWNSQLSFRSTSSSSKLPWRTDHTSPHHKKNAKCKIENGFRICSASQNENFSSIQMMFLLGQHVFPEHPGFSFNLRCVLSIRKKNM